MPVLNHRPDLHAISGLLLEIQPDEAVIELAGIMPGQGGSSGLTIGINYGMIVGQLVERGIRLSEVSPAIWKKALGVQRRSKDESKKDLKERSISLALNLFPVTDFKAGPRCKIYHDGMAEAMLLAEFARRLHLRGAA